jgi:2-iminobutanoate/2-iminopropanoate deaminase
MRATIHTDAAPAAVGPYSQAIRAGDQIWVSGQIGLDPASGRLVEGGVEAETRRVLASLKAILEVAGSGLDRVVKATVYLADLGDFETVNRVYAGFFGEEPPARMCVGVSSLPKGARVAVDAVAVS